MESKDTQLPAEVLRYKAGAAEYYMQHNYRELYGLLQNIFMLAENAAKTTRTWYTEKEMYNYLRTKNYSHEIAEELAIVWLLDFQGAYQKGVQHTQQENEQLKRWKMEATELLTPIHAYVHKHIEVSLGQCGVKLVLERCKQFDALQAKCDKFEKENKDLKEALKALVDVLPKGEKLHYYHAKEQLIYARGVLVIHNEALSAGDKEVKPIEYMPVHPEDAKRPECPKQFPMHLLNEAKAQSNHSQSLKRLKERGGLSVAEILAIVGNKPWNYYGSLKWDDKLKMLNELLNQKEDKQ